MKEFNGKCKVCGSGNVSFVSGLNQLQCKPQQVSETWLCENCGREGHIRNLWGNDALHSEVWENSPSQKNLEKIAKKEADTQAWEDNQGRLKAARLLQESPGYNNFRGVVKDYNGGNAIYY